MKRRVLAALTDAGLKGERLLVAVSGGVDSMVLLHLLGSLRSEIGLSLCVGHVHHGLREDAERDAESVERAARALDLPYRETRIAPNALRDEAPNSRVRPSLQEASRQLRYRALGEMARREHARAVATAHNRDDQVETVLLRLLRGSGPDGAAGMRLQGPWPGRGDTALTLVRPLLAVAREEILEFANRRRVSWREDRSNSDLGYARNRLRSEWLPGLRDAFNPQLDRAIARFADALHEERSWLQGLEDAEAGRRFERLEDGTLRIDIKEWSAVPRALARRLARRALLEMGAGREVTAGHLERILAFFPATEGDRSAVATLELPGGLRLRRERGRASPAFRLERAPLPPSGGC